MQASHLGNEQAVVMLLERSADPMLMGRDGTAVDLAKDNVRDLLQRKSEYSKSPQGSVFTACGSESTASSPSPSILAEPPAIAPAALQDFTSVSHRPDPRLLTEPIQGVKQCVKDAMSISCFDGKTSKFIDPLMAKAWSLAQGHIGRGILKQRPGLTESGTFALVLFTMQLQSVVKGATAQDEFYFQFGNALRQCDAKEMEKLKGYLYHFHKGMEAMPKHQGTLWRGVHGDFAKAAPDNFDLYSIITFNGYSSASPSRKVAKQFEKCKGLLLKFIDVNSSARDVREMSAYPKEEERTILAGSKFIVVRGAFMSEDGTMEIHLKEASMKHA